MDGYLSKPIDDVELFARLNDVATAHIGRALAPAAGDRRPLAAVDPARLEMIADVMAGDALGEFIDVFLASTAERISRIQGFDSDNLIAIGQEAHTLLGTAGNFGALQLSGLGAELREACDAGDRALARIVAGKLTEALDLASAAILAWMNAKTAARAA